MNSRIKSMYCEQSLRITSFHAVLKLEICWYLLLRSRSHVLVNATVIDRVQLIRQDQSWTMFVAQLVAILPYSRKVNWNPNSLLSRCCSSSLMSPYSFLSFHSVFIWIGELLFPQYLVQNVIIFGASDCRWQVSYQSLVSSSVSKRWRGKRNLEHQKLAYLGILPYHAKVWAKVQHPLQYFELFVHQFQSDNLNPTTPCLSSRLIFDIFVVNDVLGNSSM